MHNIGCSGLVHWDDPEGWDGEGGRRGVQDGEHMYMDLRKMVMITLYARQQKRHRYILQYSCMENSIDRGARWVTVFRVTKSQT